MAIYKLFWDDYCSWYLEAVKPAFGEAIDKATMTATEEFLENLLKMIHPVMPFISEELWQSMSGRKEGKTIMYQPSPVAGEYDEKVISDFEAAKEVAGGVRATRQQKNIPPKEALDIKVKGDFPMEMMPLVTKLSNVGKAEKVSETSEGNGVSFMVGTVEVFIPLDGFVDAEAEISKLETELTRLRGFLEGVRKKLSNESFTAHAPEKVVAMERKKEADALLKIENIEKSLKSFKSK